MDPRILAAGLVPRSTRHFGVPVLCDPYIYVHRNGYWCGVFFEEELENYLKREIRAGDTVIDVGMNVGHVSIPAAVLVGAAGSVISFEPNRDLASAVEAHAAELGLRQLTILPYGLGDVAGTFELRMDPAHTGGASFRDRIDDLSFTKSVTCETRVGDEVLAGRKLSGRVLLKMDVEGFEIQALTGLSKTLDRVDHAVIEVEKRRHALEAQGLTVGSVTWRDEAASWPQALETDRSQVIDPDSLGIHICGPAEAELAIILFRGGWADVDFIVSLTDAGVIPANDVTSAREFGELLDRCVARVFGPQ